MNLYTYCWNGPPDIVTAAITGQINVIGPIVLDGVAYVSVRSSTALAPPTGLSVTPPQLSAAVIGVWDGDGVP